MNVDKFFEELFGGDAVGDASKRLKRKVVADRERDRYGKVVSTTIATRTASKLTLMLEGDFTADEADILLDEMAKAVQKSYDEDHNYQVSQKIFSGEISIDERDKYLNYDPKEREKTISLQDPDFI